MVAHLICGVMIVLIGWMIMSAYVMHHAKLEGKLCARVLGNTASAVCKDSIVSLGLFLIYRYILCFFAGSLPPSPLPFNVESTLVSIRGQVCHIGNQFNSEVSVVRERFSTFI